MASAELMKLWKRTEGFLLDARSHLSETAEGTFADEIREFDEYIRHNELELALDILEDVFQRSGIETWRVLELMASAAASMGLLERQLQYDNQLSIARGCEYKTVLPTLRGIRFALELTVDELRIVNNVLNEVCNGVEFGDAEFVTRIGSPRKEVLALLQRVSRLLK